MLNPSQFQQWCRERSLETATVDLLARIRFSPPVRRVQGRAGNVRGLLHRLFHKQPYHRE
ncbi:hypothetical protein Krac_9319 [Ktedonobacter racemifer DSM 44963]|uniref:Uncharacterized protein n=1 Tax=Ktedonobacter racemifer DSM 44963 TaxID=485913 RepID=D6TBH3_KTERA|nr:hypothetical protein Krac_9319 [Ktedonobacter racemifer DSM 44963]